MYADIAPKEHSIKAEYKDQFEKAMEVAQQHLKQMVPRKEVVDLLNDQGFKTRTGRKWSCSILNSELRKPVRNIDSTKAGKIEEIAPYSKKTTEPV